MPYRRSYRRSYARRPYRRPYRQAPRASKFVQYASTAVAAYNMAKKLKGVINSELKHHDATSSTAISSTGLVVHLSDIAQGDSESTRDGRSILPKSIYLQGHYVMNATASRTSIRTVLILDRRPDAGAPTWTDVYESADVNSLRNISSDQGRFRVLYERTDTLTDGGKEISLWKKFVPISRVHCKFDGTAATDTSQNAFYLLQVSSEATNTPSQSLQSRLRFYDN